MSDFRGIVISKVACAPAQEKHFVKKVGRFVRHVRSGTLCFTVECCDTILLKVENATADSGWHKPNRTQIVTCSKCEKRQQIEAGGAGGIRTRCPDSKLVLDQEVNELHYSFRQSRLQRADKTP